MNTPEPASPAEVVLIPPKKGFLKKLGAGSLAISVIFHVVLVAIGVFIVVANIPPEKEKEVDFRARGGGGGAPASSTAQKKMQANMSKQMPNRVAAANVASNFVLPEPSTSGALSTLGSMSGNGGMGGSGSGGGSGAGVGTGTGNGMGMGVGGPGGKGLMVFGTALPDVHSIGVVMDVSGSMTPNLPRVLKELDRVAKGSPVMLHVGCGIGSERTRPRIDSVLSPMKGDGSSDFKGFWCFYQDAYYRNNKIVDRKKVDLTRTLPLPEIYESFAKRPNTYYNDCENPLRSTADALTAREFEKVDAIYWFADFQDKVEEKAAEEVLRTLKRRKQKLFIHASAQGNYIDVVRNSICLPSGGKEIVSKEEPKKGK